MKTILLTFLLLFAVSAADAAQKCTSTTSGSGTTYTECSNPRMTCTTTRSASGTIRTECRKR
jgi:hypothetical protein